MKTKSSFHFSLKSTVIKLLFYFLVNLKYVIFCLPVFTIGAAQAALYKTLSAIDREKCGRNPVSYFYRQFLTGFGKVTFLWCVGFLGALFFLFCFAACYIYIRIPVNIPAILFLLCLVFVLAGLTQVPLIHIRVPCSYRKMPFMVWYLLIKFPLQCLLCGILFWSPFVILLASRWMTVRMLPFLFVFYYSLIFEIIRFLMKKPLKHLAAYMERQNTPEYK